MSLNDDLSWAAVDRIARRCFNDDPLDEMATLGGGVINSTVKLKTRSGHRAMLKIAPHRATDRYEHEAEQLKLLASLGVATPKVLMIQTGSLDQPDSFLLLEFVEAVPLHEAEKKIDDKTADKLQRELADLAAKLHGVKNDKYGRLAHACHSRWCDFFREAYTPILQECDKLEALPSKVRHKIDKIHCRLDQLLAHADCPRLLHWDFWSGNILCAPDEHGCWHIRAVIDPECIFGHAEAEVAYMELFHTARKPFRNAYRKHHALNDSYNEVRRPVYQLYALLNHLQLHGQERASAVIAHVEERLSALV